MTAGSAESVPAPGKRVRTRRVVMLGYPDAEILDIAGPLEVFSECTRWLRGKGISREPAYAIEVVGLRAGPFVTTSGVRLVAERSFIDVADADLLLISGGRGCNVVAGDKRVLQWIRRLASRGTPVGSVCTGALILARAGLLDGRSATTHWSATEQLARAGPGITVRSDAIYVRDGNIYTSAGVTAGIDMALAIVEQDWGRMTALSVARVLVVFLNRPGGQSQFSDHLAAQFSEDDKVRRLQLWILDHLDEDLSVSRLAARVAMSSRNFSRRFTGTVRVTPAQYVANARLAAARRKLEENKLHIAQVAGRCGFGTEEAMRRAFSSALGITPTDYRRRFSISG